MKRWIVAACCLGLGMAPRLALAQAVDCGPAPPIEEPTKEAREVYESALEHTRDGRYPEALAAYQRAYDLSPSYVILFNIGKAAELTGDSARAIIAYRCHLEHGGSEIGATKQAEVTASMNALYEKVGLVAFVVDEPGARISIDGSFVGTSPIDVPVPVNPGRRLVRVEGARTESRTIDVEAKSRVVVDFKLKEGAKASAGDRFRFPSGVVGAAWITAGLLGASTAVTGALALIGAKDIEDDVYLGPGRRPPVGSVLDEKIERTEALATATDVLLTAFLITGSAAISFSVVNAVNKVDEPATVSVGLAPGGGFLRIGFQ
ncbi:MAG: PEGA domain-containing protein [Polyangiaceae bacterium]|nr:PEGA domain-containing protein [Polyangiaceae bacterium]